MKRLMLLCLAFAVLAAMPLYGQEKKMSEKAAPSMQPPKPLSDDLCKWMIGQWEGMSTSPMGKSQDNMKIEWGLGNQFVLIYYSSKWTDVNEHEMQSMAQSMKMSKEDLDKMLEMPYKAMGPMTINPATGEYEAYWFDNWRGVSKGSGKRQGNVITMKWEGPMGAATRTIEKVSDDKMVMNFKEPGPGGEMMEGTSEFTRSKMAGKQ